MNKKAGKGLGPQVTCPRKSWDEITVEREEVHRGNRDTMDLILSWVTCLLIPGINLLRVSRIYFTKGVLPEISYLSSLKAINGEEQKDSKCLA